MCTGMGSQRDGGYTRRLFGGWFRGQRPHSQDGPLPSREGLDTEAGRLRASIALCRTKYWSHCKPTLLHTHVMSKSGHHDTISSFSFVVGFMSGTCIFQGISVNVLKAMQTFMRVFLVLFCKALLSEFHYLIYHRTTA